MKILSNVLILYLLTVNPLSSIALCWGDNGQIDIESATESHICCDESDSDVITIAHESTFEDNSPNNEDCSHCVDILLSLKSEIDATVSTTKTLNKQIKYSTYFISESFSFKVPLSTKPLLKFHLTPSNTLVSLKSIQLLI